MEPRYEGRGDYGPRDGARDGARNIPSSSGPERGSDRADRGPPPSDRPYYGGGSSRDAPLRDSRDMRGDPRDRDSGGSLPPPPEYRDGPSSRGPYSDSRDTRDDRRDGRDGRDSGRDFRGDGLPPMRGNNDLRSGDMRPSDIRGDRERDGGRDSRDSFRDGPSFRQGYPGGPPPSRPDYREKPSSDPKFDSRYDGPPPPQRRDDGFDAPDIDRRPSDPNGPPYPSGSGHQGPSNSSDGVRRSHGDFGRRSNDRDSPRDRDGRGDIRDSRDSRDSRDRSDRDRDGERGGPPGDNGRRGGRQSQHSPQGPISDSPLRAPRMDPSGGRPSLEHRQHSRPSIMGPSHSRPSITAPMRQQFDGPSQGGSSGRRNADSYGSRGSESSRSELSPSRYPSHSHSRPSIMQGSNNNNNRSYRNSDYDRDRDGSQGRSEGFHQKRSSDFGPNSGGSQSSHSTEIKKENLSSSDTAAGSTDGSAETGSINQPSAPAIETPQGPSQGEVLAGIEIKEDEIVEVSKELENLMKEREKLMKEVSTSESARSKGKILNLVHGLPIRPEWLSMTSVEVVKATYEQNLRLSLRADDALTAQLVDASLRAKYAPFLNFIKTTSKHFRYQAIHAAVIKNFVTSARVSLSSSPAPGSSQDGPSLHSSSTTTARDTITDDSKMQISDDTASSAPTIAQPTPSNAMQVDNTGNTSIGNTRSSSPLSTAANSDEDVVVVDADYLPDIHKRIRDRVNGESTSTQAGANGANGDEEDAVEMCEEATEILHVFDNAKFFDAVPSPSIDQFDCYKANLEQHASWKESMVQVLAEKRREVEARTLNASKQLRKANLQWYRQLQLEKEEEASRKLLQNKKWLHFAQAGRKTSVRSSANLTSSGGANEGAPAAAASAGTNGGRGTPSMLSGSSSSVATPAKKRWLSTSVGGDDSEEEEEDEERFEATRAEVPPMLIFDQEADDHRRDMIDHNGVVEDSRFKDVELKVSRPWHPDEEDVFVRAFLRFHKDFTKIASYLPTKDMAEVIWFYYTRKFKLDIKRRYQREGMNQLQLMTLGLSALTPSDPAAATLAHYMGSAVEWVNGNTRRGSLRLLEKGSAAPGTPGAAPPAGAVPGGVMPASGAHSMMSGSSKPSMSAGSGFDRHDRADPSYVPGGGKSYASGSAASGSGGGMREGREKMSLMASTSSAASHGHGEDENVDIERSLAASGGAEGTYSPGRGAVETQNRWTAEEREKFKAAFDVHYKDFKAISEIMRTKNAAQCKNYYHNNKKKLGLPSIARTPTDAAPSAAPPKQSPPSSPVISSRTVDSSDIKSEAQNDENNISGSSSSLRASANLSNSTSIRLSSDAVDSYNAEVRAETAKAPVADGPKKSIVRVNNSHWTDDEKAKFKELLQIHGKDWKSLANGISSKTVNQIKNFFQNYRNKLSLDDLLPEADRNNANARGGRGKKRKVKPRGRPKRTASADADDDGTNSDWMDEDSDGAATGDETEPEDDDHADQTDDEAEAPRATKDVKRKREGDPAASLEDTTSTAPANGEQEVDEKENLSSLPTEPADDSHSASDDEHVSSTSTSKRGRGGSRGGSRGGRGGKSGSRASTPTPPPTKKRKLEGEGDDTVPTSTAPADQTLAPEEVKTE